jgi:tyrosine-protein phosphatase SIW14
MPRFFRYLFSILIVVLLVGGPLAYASYRKAHIRNFRVVRDGVLYRSGQLSPIGLKTVLEDHAIKTVITLRDAYQPGNAPPDWEEEQYCREQGIGYYRIPPRNWWAPDGSVPAEEGVRKFLEIMDNPENRPVLIHCFRGVHRSGAFCAIYRMEYERWSRAEAIAEMQACGYTNLDDEWDILSYLEQYRPRWQKQR